MRVLSFDCGITNLAWCLYDSYEAAETAAILDWRVVDIKSNKLPLTETLMQFLDRSSIADWFAVKDNQWPDKCHVVIEKQPFRNSAAKSVESCLYNYFTLRGRIDQAKIGGKILDRICVFSAKHKLAGEKVLRGKKAYRQRKEKSVELARALNVVSTSEQWQNLLESLPKKDDVCDALLQAIAYVNRTPHEQATSLLPRVIARRPKLGTQPLDYTDANCKYVLKSFLYPRLRKERVHALELLPGRVKQVKDLELVVNKKFGNLDAALQKLKL